jgi:hypothetical protein
MKKLKLSLNLFAVLGLLMLGLSLGASAQAQCTPTYSAISQHALTYTLSNADGMTQVRFYLDYAALENAGVYGLQLEVFLSSAVTGVSGLDYALEGSWLFGNASLSIDLHYNAVTHSVSFHVVRTDCRGIKGTGFIGALLIYRGQGADAAVQSLSGGIVMVDNVDAG